MNQNQSQVTLNAYLKRKKQHTVQSLKQVGTRPRCTRVIASSTTSRKGMAITAMPLTGINAMFN